MMYPPAQRVICFLGAMAFVQFGLAFVLHAAGGPPATPVSADEVVMEQRQKSLKVQGRLNPRQQADLSPQISAQVVEVLVQKGDQVERGQVLAKLDDRRFRQQKRELQARRAHLQAQRKRLMALLELQSEEIQELEEAEKKWAGSISRATLRQAKIKWTDLEGQSEQLQAESAVLDAQMEQIDLNLSYHQLKAPFSGQIVEKFAQVGNWMSSGSPAFRLLNPKNLEVQLHCPADLFALSQAGSREIEIFLPQLSLRLKAVLESPRGLLDPSSKTFQWLGRLEKSDRLLMAGLDIEAHLPLSEQAQVLTIDNNAILKNDAGAFVYKIASGPQGSMALPTPIVIEQRMGQRSIIAAGALKAGDKIVNEGGERLFPMMPVSIVGAQP